MMLKLLVLIYLYFISYYDIKYNTFPFILSAGGFLLFSFVKLLDVYRTIAQAQTSLLSLLLEQLCRQYLNAFLFWLSLTFLICLFEYLSKHFLLGGGDIKLLGLLSISYGIEGSLTILLFACCSSLFPLLYLKFRKSEKTRSQSIPFIPFIALMCTLLYN